jgi:hypothetical protein
MEVYTKQYLNTKQIVLKDFTRRYERTSTGITSLESELLLKSYEALKLMNLKCN